MNTRTPLFLAVVCVASLSSAVRGADLYVAPTDGGGLDTNPATKELPLASIPAALKKVAPGDTIYLLPGTHSLTSTLPLKKSGTEAAPIRLWAAGPGPTVLDFSGDTNKEDRGVQLSADHWHLKGFVIQKAPDNGLNILGSHNVVENLVVRNNGDSGVQLSGSEGRQPSHNLLLNVDSCENYDRANRGENADGFALKFRHLGEGNVLRGCRAFRNSDDGYDFWGAGHGVTMENCWAFENGVDFDHLGKRFNGDGNGFKLGQDSGQHVLRNCKAWNNPGNGFDINGNARPSVKPDQPIPHGVMLVGNIAYNNGRNFSFPEAFGHQLFNNVSFGGKGPDSFAKEIQSKNNTWNAGAPQVAESDFVSLDSADGIASRSPDGTLPSIRFLALSPASPARELVSEPLPTTQPAP